MAGTAARSRRRPWTRSGSSLAARLPDPARSVALAALARRKPSAMKVTDIRTAEVRGHGFSTYVRIYTDEGLVGNGECIHGGDGCPRAVHGLKPLLVGEDPLNVDALFEKMRRARLFDGAMAGATVTAMTGIEI